MENLEVWKSVKGYEGFYEVSNFGNVRSVDRLIFCKSKVNANRVKGCIRKLRPDKNGYSTVNLKIKQFTVLKKVHRLVGECFIENPLNYDQINHKNGIKDDNRVENLEWCNALHNARHRTITRITKPVLTDDQIDYIKNNIVPYQRIAFVSPKQINTISYFADLFHVNEGTIRDVIANKRLYQKYKTVEILLIQ